MSPGPSLAVVVSASLQRGKAAGLAVAWGHALGVALYALLTILGVATLITAVPALFKAIQVAGAVYLIYLRIVAVSLKPTHMAMPDVQVAGISMR